MYTHYIRGNHRNDFVAKLMFYLDTGDNRGIEVQIGVNFSCANKIKNRLWRRVLYYIQNLQYEHLTWRQ